MMTGFTDGRHVGADAEEWLFAAWTPDATLGIVSGHRITGKTAWYWAALAREGRPLLHVLDHGITVRSDPFIVKGEALWAEHVRDAPMEQWSIGNETYAAGLDDPAEALGRAYGDRTAIAFGLEWSATANPVDLAHVVGETGYMQEGAVHGVIEVLGEPPVEMAGLPARRWHRWTNTSGESASLNPVELPAAVAHGGVRAPFAFPDGTIADLVLGPDGWCHRVVRLR